MKKEIQEIEETPLTDTEIIIEHLEDIAGSLDTIARSLYKMSNTIVCEHNDGAGSNTCNYCGGK